MDMTRETFSKVDVLIIGAGPAGLMAATWMARCGINARIIDKRGIKIFTGQADGLQCRTLEILDSFDLADRVWKESNHMLEICLWNPDSEGKLRRSDRIPDTIPGISRFQQVVLHQGRIEQFFLDSLEEHSKIKVERGIFPYTLAFDETKVEDPNEYPIEVVLQHLTDDQINPRQSQATRDGAATSDGLFRSNIAADDDTDEVLSDAHENDLTVINETVKAKYLIGCDGAHSWTRRQLGIQLEGEQTDLIWGVLDIIPLTNFPDIRMRCAIHSSKSGSMMVIPRENKLVRLYIQITTTEIGSKIERWSINPKMILDSAQKIMAPYKIDYEYCDWWTGYQIGQRVASNFSQCDRIFLAGDAVHTHSPKAGQGMNVSMQDTYNLGWKIAAVLNGTATRSILKTYESERHAVAQELITFDHKFSRLFSGRPAKDIMDEEGISMEEFKDVFEKGNLFASGVSVNYGASIIVAKEDDAAAQGYEIGVASNIKARVIGKQRLASNIKIGMRMPSFKVLNQSDARPWHFQELLKSDGRWRIVVFAGDISNGNQMFRIEILSEGLKSLTAKYTLGTNGNDSAIEILMIHSAPRINIELLDLPEIFHPWSKRDGCDYNKVYVDDLSYHEGYGKAYEGFGVDKKRGCMVLVRPDQYVSWIGELEDGGEVEGFLEGFMVGKVEGIEWNLMDEGVGVGVGM
ncbi:putative fad binding domain protein [Botrytis fragariae]|uniref:Putative fad binding domain protein n=1 Tax=Botrytis fragariae TaxID=1964551 RepID=A0A8H6EKK8_9HELO|nr:putative fad binding domain protein [Botrytis fragariae]KAF5875687.1 putative fad binding domain protein [Botrytis fragariae]